MVDRRCLVIVVDGLRPDAVTARDTPVLDRLRERGTVFSDTHAALPSVTLVNGSVLATGRYPAVTGILGNRMLVPEAGPTEVLTLTDATNLAALAAGTGGIVQTPTLAEHLQDAGKRLVVVGSGSAGTTFCAGPGAFVGAGVVINGDDPRNAGPFAVPAAIGDEVLARFGPPPVKRPSEDRVASVAYACRVTAGYVLPEIDPDVTVLWLTEPDFTQHAGEVGSPTARQVLRQVDEQVGVLLDTMHRRGTLAGTDVLVVSDHGCTRSGTGAVDVAAELVAAGIKADHDSDDVVVVNNGSLGIHVRDREPGVIAAVVRLLQRHARTGVLFTSAPAQARGDERDHGWVEGTFSLELLRLDARRGRPDILMAPDWESTANGYGFAGTTSFAGPNRSSHGGMSPWDVRSTLIAAGPSFRPRSVVSTPVGNVDVAPTVLSLAGIDPPEGGLDGRVLSEALAGSGVSPPAVECSTVTTTTGDAGYRAVVRMSMAGGARYVDSARRTRG